MLVLVLLLLEHLVDYNHVTLLEVLVDEGLDLLCPCSLGRNLLDLNNFVLSSSLRK